MQVEADQREVSASLRSWMAAVRDISQAVNAAQPLKSLLCQVAEKACELIGFEFCAVMLVDGTGERVLVEGWHGLSADYVQRLNTDRPLVVHPRVPELDLPAARAYRERRTVVVPDVRVARPYERLRVLAPLQGYRALLAVPLGGADAARGVVVAYSVEAREFTAAEVELVELLAEQAAVAIETAGLRSGQDEVIAELSKANATLQEQRAALDWAERQHRRLMQLVLDGVGLTELVESLAVTLHASVTLEDNDAHVIARAADGSYVPPPNAAMRRRKPVRAALAALHERYEVAHVTVQDATSGGGRYPAGGLDAWVAPVVLGGCLVGRLWLTGRQEKPSPIQRRLIERFALVVAFELCKLRDAAELEARLSRDLLSELLSGDSTADEHGLLDRATALGHDLTAPHALLLLANATADRDGGRSAAAPANQSRALAAVHNAVRSWPAAALVGAQGDDVVVLLPTEEADASASRVADAADAIRMQVDQMIAPSRTTAVIGPVCRGIDQYASAYRVARSARRLAGPGPSGRVVDVRDLGLHGLLLEAGLTGDLRGFARRLLGPLAEHDADHRSCLVDTLRTWLDCQCSTADAAAALVVHPNTMNYRLARIERLLGMPVRQPSTQLQLQLALTVHDIERAAR